MVKPISIARAICALLVAASGLVLSAAPARASSLDLSYTVTPEVGGTYLYNFQLTLTNADGSWGPGQGWNWIIFGDTTAMTPGNDGDLTNWSGQTVSAPFSGFLVTSGGHNGPTLFQPGVDWVPTAVGGTLDWSGTSTADLTQGELLFSTLVADNGAEAANFQVANVATPEPSTSILLAASLLGLLAATFCRKQSV